MTLLLILLLIFIVILLVGQFVRSANRRTTNHGSIQDSGRDAQTNQSSTFPAMHTNEWWLHSSTPISTGHTDDVFSNDSTSFNYGHDSTAAGVDCSVDFGSTDFSSGSDCGGGGDAGGGGGE